MNGSGNRQGNGFPVEEFVQRISAQLDRAQDALALKARTGRPLTFALKDLSIDLKVFWDMQRDGTLRMRHAEPNEDGASTVHLSFTTITRSMVEENTVALTLDEDPRSLRDLGGGQVLDDDDRRRLELVGVRTVGQFRRLSAGADPRQVEAYLGIPVNRLRAALERSAQPAVLGHEVISRRDRDHLLRIQGANLDRNGPPAVRVDGRPAEVLEASATELLVRPLAMARRGHFEVACGDDVATGFFELPPDGADPPTSRAVGNAEPGADRQGNEPQSEPYRPGGGGGGPRPTGRTDRADDEPPRLHADPYANDAGGDGQR
jgi:hypothetical protein